MSLFARARHQANLKAQYLSSIESALRDMAITLDSLHLCIRAEETRNGVRDPQHAAYSTVALAARRRIKTLEKSVSDLEARRVAAIADHDTALAKLNGATEGGGPDHPTHLEGRSIMRSP